MPNLVAGIANSIAQSKARVVFIDNIGQEHGPAGQLSLNQRIEWMENCIGHRINAVITTDDAGSELPNIFKSCENLSANDVYYRHDRNKLSKAIDELLAQNI